MNNQPPTKTEFIAALKADCQCSLEQIDLTPDQIVITHQEFLKAIAWAVSDAKETDENDQTRPVAR